MGAVSLAWSLLIINKSQSVLGDSITGLGFFHRPFFRRKWKTADSVILDGTVKGEGVRDGGLMREFAGMTGTRRRP